LSFRSEAFNSLFLLGASSPNNFIATSPFDKLD